MTALAHYTALLAALVVVAAGCHKSNPPQPSRSADWWTSTNSPAIQLWDCGIPMLRKPPFVIFALWSDGIVVRRVDGRLQQGQASPQEIRKLMNEVEAAGFFSPPVPFGLTHPDALARCLAVMRNGHLTHLDYDGDSDFHDVGPRASPSRQQMEAFVQMWQRVVRAIDMVPTGQLRDLHGERELRYPGR